MEWVVGLIIPMEWPPSSVNQQVAVGARSDMGWSGIGDGDGELGDCVGRRTEHANRVGAPIGEPEVPIGPECDIGRLAIGRGNWELSDRQQATVFQPLEPESCPPPFGGSADAAAFSGQAGRA